jgi:hypothetical protein
MEWNDAKSQRKKKFKAELSAGNVMTTILWDSAELQLVITKTRTTINSVARVKTLKSFIHGYAVFVHICREEFCCCMTIPGRTSVCEPQGRS